MWPGETAFLLAGGPSLQGFDSEQLRGHGRVIVVNDSFRLCPWADLLFFGDRQWWEWRRTELESWTDRMITTAPIPDPAVHRVTLTGKDGLEVLPDRVRGNNSGYMAINVAYHLGVKRIVLLGYDMKLEGARTHWHKGYDDKISLDRRRVVLGQEMLCEFPTLVEPLKTAGVEVINANPDSAIECWPRVNLGDIAA